MVVHEKRKAGRIRKTRACVIFFMMHLLLIGSRSDGEHSLKIADQPSKFLAGNEDKITYWNKVEMIDIYSEFPV
jgi:hypothetical protein